MSNRFPRDQVDELLVACHRRCCICYKFCGVKIETDHIVPVADGGPDTIDNAIPVCFECHADIHAYNDRHPRGRKYRPEELRKQKDQWLEICQNRPEIFINAASDSDVGPLQALIDELEYNLVVAEYPQDEQSRLVFVKGVFHIKQFERAIQEGAISILQDELKQLILEAYAAMGHANQASSGNVSYPGDTGTMRALITGQAIGDAINKITAAHNLLLKFLGSE